MVVNCSINQWQEYNDDYNTHQLQLYASPSGHQRQRLKDKDNEEQISVKRVKHDVCRSWQVCSPHPFTRSPDIYAKQYEALPVEISGVGQCLGFHERIGLSVFLRYVNTLAPYVPLDVLNTGLSVVSTASTSISTRSGASASAHASQAVVWACVACGAAAQRIIHAPQYLFVAKEHLRHCFDHPSRETLAALCAVALGSYYIDPRGTFCKYANFAIIIFSELKQSLTVEQQRETWTAMELLRAYVMNERVYSQDVQALDSSRDMLQACTVADPEGWTILAPDGGMLDNGVLRIFYQLEQTLGHFRDGATSNPQTRTQSLIALRDTCTLAQMTGDVASNPALQKILRSSLLFVYVHMNQLDAATEAAKLCVRTFETFPMLLTWTRKPSSIHALLDVAELLADDRLQERIASVRRAVPDADIVHDAEDIEEVFHMSMRDQLMKQLPVRAAQPHLDPLQHSLTRIDSFEDFADAHILEMEDLDDVLRLLDPDVAV
jgi:hypothetical protein